MRDSLEIVYRAITEKPDEFLGVCDNNDGSPGVYVDLVYGERGPNWRNLSFTRDFFFDQTAVETFELFKQVLLKFIEAADESTRIYETALPAGFGKIPEAHRTIMSVEASSVHSERLRRVPDDYPTKIRELIESGESISAVHFKQALDIKREMWLQYQYSNNYGGMTLCVPATTDSPPDRKATGNPAFNSPWSFLGVPVVSLPVGYYREGLPYCFQLVHAGSDHELLKQAIRFEELVGLPPIPLPPIHR